MEKSRKIDDHSFLRVYELKDNPNLLHQFRKDHSLPDIRLDFGVEYLRTIHAYIFQDAPRYGTTFVPGGFRDPDDSYGKTRRIGSGEKALEYKVIYSASSEIEKDLTRILNNFGGHDSLRGLDAEQVSERLAKLYADLDHVHSFGEGNSRTLREFIRQLALEAGFTLDWDTASVDDEKQHALYVARDMEVMNRRFPNRVGLPPSTNAWLYGKHAGSMSLKEIIRNSLQPLAKTVDSEQNQ